MECCTQGKVRIKYLKFINILYQSLVIDNCAFGDLKETYTFWQRKNERIARADTKISKATK